MHLSISAFSRLAGAGRALLVVGGLSAFAALARVSLCPLATLTGVPCPGCGLLRATFAFASGHVAESIRIHPLALVAVPFAVYSFFRLQSSAPRSKSSEHRFAALTAAVVLAMVAVWVARLGGSFGGPVPVNSLWRALPPPG